MQPSVATFLLAALAASTGVVGNPVPANRTGADASSAPSSAPPSAPPSTASSSFPPPGPPIQPADPNLIARLDTAPSNVGRYKIIKDEAVPLVFKFNSGPNTGKGGKIVVANRANFPPLVSTNIAAAVGFIEPCGLNTIHTHPRASEFLTVVQGTMQTGFILENGLTSEFNATLNQFEGTVFPQGSIHFQFNPKCEPAIFVAGLNSEDPGASQLAQNIFAIQQDVVEANFGFQEPLIAGAQLDKFIKNIPTNVALGVRQCLDSCPKAKNA